VQSRCEALGFTLSAAEVDLAYRAVIALGEHRKVVVDGDLRRIVERIRSSQPASAPAAAPPHAEAIGYGHGV
jgi:hypothetical protein